MQVLHYVGLKVLIIYSKQMLKSASLYHTMELVLVLVSILSLSLLLKATCAQLTKTTGSSVK